MLRLIKNAKLYSPEKTGKAHLLLGGGKILQVSQDEIVLPKNISVEVFDAEGQAVVPGFIDAHTHITGGGGESGPQSRVPAVNLSEFTRFGVTTVVGVLGTDDLTRNTSTLITQARALNAEGMTAFVHTGGYHMPLSTLTGSAKSDIVHVEQIIGVGEFAISDHRSSQPTLEEFLRIASESYVAGLMTGKAGILHLHMGNGKRGLDLVRQAIEISEIPARVYNPTHVNRNKALFKEACAITKLGVNIDVTAMPVEPDEDAWSAHHAIDGYLQAGHDPKKITVSSDGGGCLPVFNNQGEMLKMGVGSSSLLVITLKELLKMKYTLEEVLPIFTSNISTYLRFAHKGKLEVGCDADLVRLSADGNVLDVMARGEWHMRDGQVVKFGQFEQR